MNPEAPIPPMAPPPAAYGAPPPRKSNALKWILIGCGGVTLLGAVLCAGVVFVAYQAIQKIGREVAERARELIQKDERITAELGNIQSVEPRFTEMSAVKQDGQDVVHMKVDVTGDRGRGVVGLEIVQERGGKEALISATLTTEGGNVIRLGTWRAREGGQGLEPVDDGAAPRK